MSSNPNVRKSIAGLRKEGKQLSKDNFTFRDLRKSGLTKQEIGQIPSKRVGESIYYDEFDVHQYLKYEKGIDIK